MQKKVLRFAGYTIFGIAVLYMALAAVPSPKYAFAAAPQYVKITAQQAKQIMDGGKNITVVDVRTRGEFDEGHIKGAINVPNEDISTTPPAALPSKKAEILIYCRSGRRSAEAAKKLLKLGYTNVKDFGGIINWPYEVVK